MKKRKILIIFFLLLGLVLLNKLDKKLRFNMSLSDYYKYSKDLSIREKVMVKNNQISVGVYELPPLSYVNRYNNHNTGIAIDYLSQIAIETGSEIHVKAMDRMELERFALDSKLDARIMEVKAGLKEDQGLLVTQSLCSSSIVTIVDKNSSYNSLRDLEDKILVCLKKDRVDEELESFREGRLKIELMPVDNIYQAFALLNSSSVDGFIGKDMEIYHYINVTNSGSKYRSLNSSFNKKEIVIGVRDQDLLNILNKGIMEIKKKNLIAQTQYKWLGDQENLSIDLKYIDKLYRIGSLIVLLVVFFSSWNYLISQKVNLRTKELLESREELRLIIDSMKMGIMVIANNQVLLECNDSLCDMVGLAKDEIIGKDYGENPKLRQFANKKNLNTVLKLGNRYYYISKQKISASKCMVLIEDYTEKYFIQKRERQQSKMVTVGKLSAGLAHEIRNPLGLIKSYSYVLKMTKNQESHEKALSVINNSVDRINNLIENLLRFSKLSNNVAELVDVNSCLDEIARTYLKARARNNVRLEISYLDKEGGKLRLNEEIFRISLSNLLENSIHSFEDRRAYDNLIKIGLELREGHLLIRVEDNGCGMDEEKMENIYEPFYSSKEKGTGLGLYIVSTEVFNIGGKIFLESKVNKGTRFEVHLPIME